jgi:hypothetical protein
MIFFFGGLKWAQSFDQSPDSLSRLKRMPPDCPGDRTGDPPVELQDKDCAEPQKGRSVSSPWYFRLVWTTRKQKTAPDEVVELELPEKQPQVSMLFKSKKRPRVTRKPEAMTPEQVKVPIAERSPESAHEDVCPLPEPSPFEDDLPPMPVFVETFEDGRRRSFQNGYTSPPETEAANDVLYEFVKEESCGGPYEGTKSMSGFRLAKERAMEEARLRGVCIDKNHEVALNIRGSAQLAGPVMDKDGVLVTPALHIYKLRTS